MINHVATLPKDEVIRVDVLKAARDLFQRFGLCKTTMEDIAKAAGKGKSTLYYYYTSKDEIFNAVIEDEMHEVFATVREAVERAETAEDKMKAFTTTKIKALSQKVNLYSIVRGETDNTELIRKLRKTFDNREIGLIQSILTFGMTTREFRPIDPLDLENMAYIIVSAIRGIEMNLIEDNTITKIGDRLESVLGLMCNGIKR
jgi:AcrR family transcriptional regulator